MPDQLFRFHSVTAVCLAWISVERSGVNFLPNSVGSHSLLSTSPTSFPFPHFLSPSSPSSPPKNSLGSAVGGPGMSVCRRRVLCSPNLIWQSWMVTIFIRLVTFHLGKPWSGSLQDGKKWGHRLMTIIRSNLNRLKNSLEEMDIKNPTTPSICCYTTLCSINVSKTSH